MTARSKVDLYMSHEAKRMNCYFLYFLHLSCKSLWVAKSVVVGGGGGGAAAAAAAAAAVIEQVDQSRNWKVCTFSVQPTSSFRESVRLTCKENVVDLSSCFQSSSSLALRF